MPARFLEGIMRDLRMAGLVTSRRGVDGGYRLGRPAGSITVADIIRTVDGPLAEVRGQRPEDGEYPGCAADLREVWVAARASLRSVLENVSLADIAGSQLPDEVRSWTKDPEVWLAH
jgi:Rrf2 family protein